MSDLNLTRLTERWAQDSGWWWGLKWDMVKIKGGYHAKTKEGEKAEGQDEKSH